MTNNRAYEKARKAASPIPRRLIFVVCLLCLGILGSAIFTFTALSRMRMLYLSNRGHAIAEAIDAQARGPGKRNNPEFWQSLLEENYQTYSGSVAYLTLIDSSGRILAGKGSSALGPLETAAKHGGSAAAVDGQETMEPSAHSRETSMGMPEPLSRSKNTSGYARRPIYPLMAVSSTRLKVRNLPATGTAVSGLYDAPRLL